MERFLSNLLCLPCRSVNKEVVKTDPDAEVAKVALASQRRHADLLAAGILPRTSEGKMKPAMRLELIEEEKADNAEANEIIEALTGLKMTT
jgi:hypothetical protein